LSYNVRVTITHSPLPKGGSALASAVFVAVFAATLPATARAQSDEAARIAAATLVLSEASNMPEHEIPRSVLQKAEAVAVFPAVKKGGFVVGGQWGRGVISARSRTTDTWSSPAFLTVTGGSVGLQIGGQEIDLVLVIMDRQGLERLIKNQFKLGVDASAAAGPVGRDAQAATDLQMRAKILSYSRARGLFAGVTLNAGTIRQDRDANERFYKRHYSTRDIVLDRFGGAPDPVPAWRDLLSRLSVP
jgi:lipid-binding SYLF domain-containing protein